MKPVSVEFKFQDIPTRDVINILSNLKESKLCGHDKISAKILKDSSDITAPILTYIFNCSLQSGIFSDDWEKARLSPIYKSGNKEERGNYRPISVLSVVSKVFEKLVYVQINNYLMENNIITKHQSGFREGHSTAFSLLNITNTWLINMDSGLVNGCLFLDFKKAFDTVDHKLMLRKLNLYGIKGVALNWFTFYLSNRTQMCKINNTKTIGIIIDENLKWKKHIDSASTKISKTIGMLRRVKPFVSQDSLNIMYKSLITTSFRLLLTCLRKLQQFIVR